MGPEGAITLNDKDTVIAGTKLFPNQQTQQSPTQTVDTSRMENLLAAVLSKPAPQPVIEMNDVKLGTAIDMGAFSIQ